MAREQRMQRSPIRVSTMRSNSEKANRKNFNERVRSVMSRQQSRVRATMARYGVKASSGHSGG